MYQMNAAEQKLVEALRSGRYTQAMHALRDTTEKDSYCCLGVACDINQHLGHWDDEIRVDFVTQEASGACHNDSVLPPRVQLEFGWATDTATLDIRGRDGIRVGLAELNDNGMPFPQIADIIAAGLVLHVEEVL